MSDTNSTQPIQDDEISLVELFEVLVRGRKIIAIATVALTLLGGIYALTLPRQYTAKTTILPPQQQQASASAMLGALGAGGGAAAALGLKNPNDIYLAMLKSATVANTIVDELKLHAYYGVQKGSDKRTAGEKRSAAREALMGNTAVSNENGLIQIAVTDTNPDMAAKIANVYVEALRKMSSSFAVSSAAQRRAFYEGQLESAKNNLADAEVALAKVKEQTGIVQLESQGSATIQAAAQMSAQIAAKESELAAMKSSMTPSNPQYIAALAALNGLKSQQNALTAKSGSSGMTLSKRDMAKGGSEYIRKYRDVKYYESLFDMLAKQYEMAKLDEANEGALIQVLDIATPPEKASKPNRKLIVIVAMMGGLFCGIFVAFLLNFIATFRTELAARRLQRRR